jgi:hypothetical protein
MLTKRSINFLQSFLVFAVREVPLSKFVLKEPLYLLTRFFLDPQVILPFFYP